MELQIIGPPPRPDTLHRIACDRAAREERARQQAAIHAHADTGTRCPSCGSGIWDGDYGYCPACGFERGHNGYALDQRSADTRCGICGGPYKDCWHGCEHKATLPRCFPSAPACSILSPGRGGIKRDHPLRLAAGALPAEGTHKLRP